MRLIGRRLALYALTAWVAITVNFLLPHFMPGNPIQTMIGKLTGQVTSAEIRAIRLSFGGGLNQSLLSQYFTYIGQLFHGNLGISITLGESVSSIIRTSLPWTIGLIGVSTILSFFLGTLCGALLGWTRGSRLDSLIPTATFFQATPYFFLATVMLLVFALNLHWFPVLGNFSQNVHPGWDWAFVASVLRYGELPVISIVLSSVAGWMLGMRNMMITMVAEDFVLMSIAMGLPKRKVIMTAARNAVLPSIANLSLAIGLVVSGALLVELVFNYPGVGDLLLNAVQNEDYPLIQGIFLVITLAVLAANFLADLVYLWLDPRTRSDVAI
ncbi:MAG TPA: ABC transporter permease [Acidimicrobiales bacterium]|jgi:peptide/nickel transport system permease protein|nr:ABC transporter permease [Acidimicrobiales bacterium]